MKKTCLTVLALVFCSMAGAQQISPHVVNSSGTTFTAASAQLTFNVGEAAVTRIGTGSSQITQGLPQPPFTPTGIRENSSAHAFDAFPNPVSNELTVRSASYTGTLQVKLIDAMGRTVYSGELKGNTLNTEQLPDGIYQLVLLNTEQKIMDRKTITKIN